MIKGLLKQTETFLTLLMAFILLLQEATAYFSLVYLISGICGAAISKKLEKTIGQKVCVPTIEKKMTKKSMGTKCEVTIACC